MDLIIVLCYFRRIEEICRLNIVRDKITDPILFKDETKVPVFGIGVREEIPPLIVSHSIPTEWLAQQDINSYMIACIIINGMLTICKYPYQGDSIFTYSLEDRLEKQHKLTDLKMDPKIQITVPKTKNCSNPYCKKIGTMKKCSNCNNVRYCSKECQLSEWPFHKRNCNKKYRNHKKQDLSTGPFVFGNFEDSNKT